MLTLPVKYIFVGYRSLTEIPDAVYISLQRCNPVFPNEEHGKPKQGFEPAKEGL